LIGQVVYNDGLDQTHIASCLSKRAFIRPLDELLHALNARIDFLDIIVRRVDVHADFAHERALAMFGADGREDFGRFEVDRREILHGGRTVLEKTADELGVEVPSVLDVGAAGFVGESDLVEPVELRAVHDFVLANVFFFFWSHSKTALGLTSR
jgi:hypothetical protein